MPYREKHAGNFWTDLKFFNNLKDLRSLFIAVVFLFILSQGFASGNRAEKVYTSGNTTIVYTTANVSDVVITDGKITAAEGKTIRLLPGTRIKHGEQLTVNIASKECQEAIAAEVAKEKEKTMLAFIAERRKNIFLPTISDEIPAIFSNGQLPFQNSTLGQQNLQLTAALGSGSVSISAPVSIVNKKIQISDIHHFTVSSDLWLYTPIYAWGERAENIMVMLC
jgi:hypothetical protein